MAAASSPRALLAAGLTATTFALLIRRSFASAKAASTPKYTLHLYDHCPFCIRVELLLGLHGIPYNRVVYGYGEGAPAEKKGYGEAEGPVKLTGKKMLPVLQGPGVPAPEGMAGLPESLDICSFLIARHKLAVGCSTGRLDKWKAKFKDAKSKLSRPRVVKMPVKDWAVAADVAYARNKYEKQGFDYDAALKDTPTLLEEVNALLLDLDGLIEGEESVHSWGVSMEDITTLPDMKTLSCVDGIVWPSRVRRWVDTAYGKCAEHMELYDRYKC